MKFKIPFFKKVVEIRSNLSNPQEWLLNILGRGIVSKSGVDVSSNNALQVSTVYACVKIISETIAMLTCILYERQERGKRKAENKDLYWLLHYLPNSETTSFDFWVMYIVNLLLTGDAFALIKRSNDGKIQELWNIPSKNVTIYRNSNTNELFYKINDNDKESIYYPENIMHTRGMRFNSIDKSIDPISTARDALGLAMALEEYASKYFKNGAQVGGIVKYPQALSDDAFRRFKDDFYSSYQSVINSNKTMFLEDGADFVKVTNNPDESQANESRIFQVVEICRYFNMPPHKVFELSKATFSNIEQQSMEFVQTCIGPMATRLEATIYKDLLMGNEKRKLFAKFNLMTLLRGDSTSRKEFYQAGIQNGWFSPNDVRELEDLNTYDGGDVYMVNGNMIPVSHIETYYLSKGGNSSGKGIKDVISNGGT